MTTETLRCPLCGHDMQENPDDRTAGYTCSNAECIMPACSEKALLAISALRGPPEPPGIVTPHDRLHCGCTGPQFKVLDSEGDRVAKIVKFDTLLGVGWTYSGERVPNVKLMCQHGEVKRVR